MKSHLDILAEKTSLCMCEVEKKISDFLGELVSFDDEGDFRYNSNHQKIKDQSFESFLDSVKNP